MNKEHEAHLERIKEAFLLDVDAKYRAGQEEHGGNLWEKDVLFLVESGLEEALDMAVYMYTLREQILKEQQDNEK